MRAVLLSAALLLVAAGECRRQEASAAARPSASTAAVSPLLGSFDSDLTSASGSRWHAVDDSAAGGASKAKIGRVDGGAASTRAALHIVGEAKLKDFPFPFAGARLALGKVIDGEPTPVDISGYAGIEFWAKGDGKPYLLRVLSTTVKDYDYHYFNFTSERAWKKYRVPFSSLQQFPWGEKIAWSGKDITALMFTNYSAPGEEPGAIELFLDEVQLYK